MEVANLRAHTGFRHHRRLCACVCVALWRLVGVEVVLAQVEDDFSKRCRDVRSEWGHLRTSAGRAVLHRMLAQLRARYRTQIKI